VVRRHAKEAVNMEVKMQVVMGNRKERVASVAR
jgi:hypothetical protein